MLNNADDDYLTSVAISLLLSNRISKKFINMENKGGVLNGEFIKKHLERETELEDKVFELENQLKVLKDFKSRALKESIGVDDIGVRLLTKIAMCMQIELPQYGYECTDISIGIRHMNYGVGQLRVDGVDIDEQELQYLKTLIEPNFNNIFDNTKIASKVSSDNYVVSPVIADPDKVYKLDINYDKASADPSNSLIRVKTL